MSQSEQIAKLLAKRPMPLAELARELGATVQTMSSVIGRMHTDERVHIQRWTMADAAGGRCYPRPVYALGPGADAAKPARMPRRCGRNRRRTTVASVWDYALRFEQ